MKPAIRVDDLGKMYRIAHGAGPRERYKTLRDSLMNLAKAPLRLLGGSSKGSNEEFWALKDVSFEVHPGEVVGIIGRNGAGKSTLLKILSRITKPTSGQVTLNGRVGSLLEVGTGFHPELTGRENIYLNGSILGMSRREIDRQFDGIVAFAEVEKFLDMPVKRYSSGMYVRLAFAVAAHLEPEILIVDEVLAVGDAAFQRRCMGRMKEVGKNGRTVLFVSHNMPAVESLCTRAILLDRSHLIEDGVVTGVLAEYRRRTMNFSAMAPETTAGSVFRSVALLSEGNEITNVMNAGGDFRLRIDLDLPMPVQFPTIGVGIDDTMGQRVLTLHTPKNQAEIPKVEGRCSVVCRVKHFPLSPGDYWVKLAMSARTGELHALERAFCFCVVDAELFGEGRGFHRGVCVAPSSWDVTTEVPAGLQARSEC